MRATRGGVARGSDCPAKRRAAAGFEGEEHQLEVGPTSVPQDGFLVFQPESCLGARGASRALKLSRLVDERQRPSPPALEEAPRRQTI